jgi:hypothetical protein
VEVLEFIEKIHEFETYVRDEGWRSFPIADVKFQLD